MEWISRASLNITTSMVGPQAVQGAFQRVWSVLLMRSRVALSWKTKLRQATQRLKSPKMCFCVTMMQVSVNIYQDDIIISLIICGFEINYKTCISPWNFAHSKYFTRFDCNKIMFISMWRCYVVFNVYIILARFKNTMQVKIIHECCQNRRSYLPILHDLLIRCDTTWYSCCEESYHVQQWIKKYPCICLVLINLSYIYSYESILILNRSPSLC